MTSIFGSFLCTLTSCHVVISKRGWQCVGTGRTSRCVTRRRSREMRTTQSDLDRVQRIGSWVRNRQPIRGVSVDTACKGVQALAPPGYRKKIWDKKKSPLLVYVSPSISKTTNCVPLSWIKWEIYFYIYVFLVVHKDTAEYTTLAMNSIIPFDRKDNTLDIYKSKRTIIKHHTYTQTKK